MASASEETQEEVPSAWLRFRYWMEITFLRGLAKVVSAFPRDMVLGLADRLGWLAYYVLPEDRKVADANVEIVFGDTKTAGEKRRIARMGSRVLARNLAGLFWGSRLNKDNIRRYVDVDDANWQWFQQIRARGKGVMFITPHYGDWEMGSLATGFMGAPFLTIAESVKNPAVEQLMAELRGLPGHRVVPPRHAVVKVFKALKRGETVALLVDVNGRRGRGGVWLDFFGLQVFNGAALAELALRTGAVVVFVAAKPLPGGRIRQVCSPPVEFAPTGDHAADVRALSQQVLDLCRDLIRGDPEPWLWTYKRWKRRPTPAQGGYPFYSKYAETG